VAELEIRKGVGLTLSGHVTLDLDEACGADRTNCPGSYDFASDRSRELRSFGLFVGLGAVGLGAAATGITAILLGGSSEPDDVAVTPWISPQGAGVGVTGATW